MSITLDNLPPSVEQALRERAAAERKSPEAVIVDVLSRGLSVPSGDSNSARPRELGASDECAEFATTWREQRLIDWEAWSDRVKRRDLSGIAGERLITSEMKAVFQEQRRVDPELWK